jgi:RecA-family ATPase
MHERISRYLQAVEGAVSGQGGHSHTFNVALKLVHGFKLSATEALDALSAWNAKCSPPWSQRELEHKVNEAIKTSDRRGHGYLDGGIAKVKYMPEAIPVPEPVDNGLKRLLLGCFRKGEGVCICPSILRGDREIPDLFKSSWVKQREEWIDQLDSAGWDVKAVLGMEAESGVYIRVNPMKPDGKSDGDVSDYRHTLVEFDSIPLEEQWALIKESNLPCSAVIHSGGKSLHAWVLVNAKDADEYRERVDKIHAHFSEFEPCDGANKNPSRLSRCPSVDRFKGRQELVSGAIGAKSFGDWERDRIKVSEGVMQDADVFDSFDVSADRTTLLGTNRWICEGYVNVFVGQSGIGKSSLTMQLAMLWAMGKPAFGIPAARPMRSLIVQAENDTGDLSEQWQGVKAGIGVGEDWEHPNENRLLRDNVKVVSGIFRSGAMFASVLKQWADKIKPDLIWIDPMFAFLGGDASNQESMSKFIRGEIMPLAQQSKAAVMLIHHTAKPPKEATAMAAWQDTDFAYLGQGSAELTNAARSVTCVVNCGSGYYKMILAKRGKRAGLKDLVGNARTSVWMRHATSGIWWEEVAEPTPAQLTGEQPAGAPTPPQRIVKVTGGKADPVAGPTRSNWVNSAVKERLQSGKDCGIMRHASQSEMEALRKSL